MTKMAGILLALAAIVVCGIWTTQAASRPLSGCGLEQIRTPLGLMASLSGLLILAVLIWSCALPEHTPTSITPDKEACRGSSAPSSLPWPGFRPTCGVIAMVILVLGIYHLVVPVRLGVGGFRLAVLASGASTGVAAAAVTLLVRRVWNGNLAEAAMGLASIALCSAAVAFVPSLTLRMDDRLPMVFNAVIIGLAVATAVWTYGALRVLETSRVGRAASLASTMKRFAFVTACLALLVAAMMAAWPKLPAIATMDDSFGRLTAGVGGNLLLLLVLLGCARKLRRPTFHVLTVLAVLSTAGFLIVRMLPFAHTIH